MIPLSLFKYYKYNENSLSVLINKRIWLPSCKSFNDPHDSKIKIDLSQSDIEAIIKSIDRNKFTHDPIIFTKYIENFLNAEVESFGIFCMCEENDNQLMWSHYADKHQGFCLEFEKIPQSYLGIYELLLPITYSCKFPTINLNDIKIEKKPNGRSGITFKPSVLFHCTKSCYWKLEKEWRMHNRKVNCEQAFPGKLSSLIFGMKMPDEQKKTIRNILKDEDISYKEAYMFPDRYKIGIRELNQ